MDNLIKNSGEKGLLLFAIFKTIKKEVKEKLNKENPEINWDAYEKEINTECIRLARDIIDSNKEHPTEEDIKNARELIKKKHFV